MGDGIVKAAIGLTMTFKTFLPRILRQFLAVGLMFRNSIEILAGPMKGMRFPTRLALDNLAILFGRYESAVVAQLTTITGRGSVAYDIGSHFGFMALVLASRVGVEGKVIAFEPVPENFANLKDVVTFNHLADTITILPKAVSDTVGELTMVLRESSYMHFLERASQGQDKPSYRRMTVETATIDSLVNREGYPPPTLLKIDVEGSESLVVQGALATLRLYSPTLLIEIHGPTQARKLWELLQGSGYTWWRLTRKGLALVASQDECIAPFCPRAWTHHYLMRKEVLSPAKN
jgi:FkbM family methyltransferase